MDNSWFRRWVGSPWSRTGHLFAPLIAFLSLGCRPEPIQQPIQQPPSPETPSERIKAQERAYQTKFEQQPLDDAAKKLTEERLGHLTQLLMGTKVQKLECRRSMCRIETQHANDTAFKKFIYATFMDVRTAWHGSFAVVRVDRPAPSADVAKQGEGAISAVVFLGEERPGWPAIPEPVTEPPAKGAGHGESTPSPKPEKP